MSAPLVSGFRKVITPRRLFASPFYAHPPTSFRQWSGVARAASGLGAAKDVAAPNTNGKRKLDVRRPDDAGGKTLKADSTHSAGQAQRADASQAEMSVLQSMTAALNLWPKPPTFADCRISRPLGEVKVPKGLAKAASTRLIEAMDEDGDDPSESIADRMEVDEGPEVWALLSSVRETKLDDDPGDPMDVD